MSHLSIPVTDADHGVGPADAPVTLVEYGDYECPHCGAAYPIVKSIQSQMKNRLRFVFRNFPLSQIHENAKFAAQAAEAAGLQGDATFWKMHDRLFEHQSRLDPQSLVAHAEKLGLDVERFQCDLESEPIRTRVSRDFRSGVRSGVNGTPTFFINGERHDGGYDEPSLLEAIRAVIG